MDSALARSLKSPAALGWGNAEALLALIAQLVDLGNRQFFGAHKKKGASTPPPLRITPPPEVVDQRGDSAAAPPTRPRPGKKQATTADMARFFGRSGVRYSGEGA